MDDNVYPLDGEYFIAREPVDQVNARKKQEAQTLQALPMLNAIIERFDEQIAFSESLNSIPTEVRTKPEEFLRVYNANLMFVTKLKAEREWLISLIDQYKR